MESRREWYERKFKEFLENTDGKKVRGTSIIGSIKEEQAYLFFHKERLFEVIKTIAQYAGPQMRVLDIGTSHLTLLLVETYKNLTTIDSQDGWRSRVEPLGIHFIRHDLLAGPIPLPDNYFDLIVCSEVIEHLPVSPSLILSQIFKLLRKNGVLILTSPNAASYYHRRDMLFGKNPFQIPPVGPDLTSSWHAREYTLREFKDFSTTAGFKIVQARYPWYWNDFPRRGFINRIKGLLIHLFFRIFPSFRDAILVIATKP